MKNVELKKRFQNKYMIRVAAGAVTIAVLGTGIGAYTVHAQKSAENGQESVSEDENLVSLDEEEQKLVEKLSQKTAEKTEAGKEETVYVVADAKGAAKNIIVSEWLKNKDNADTIKDASDLKDITNVKGEESFEQKGEAVTWKADGKDIYYQGTTQKDLPVTEKVTYYLDGRETKPEDIAGKSGKVTVRFDYTNNTQTTETVDGETYEVNVPFTVMTGMILPEECDNVEVTNGKVISDGSKKVVVGVTMPGLKKSLDIKEEDLDREAEIPEYVEVTADVKNFKLDMTMSVIMSDLLSESNLDDAFDLTELDDSINTMSDASSKLVDGSKGLAEGLDTLKGSMKEFAAGVNTLKDGVNSYTSGASQLEEGIRTLKDGSGALADGAGQLGTGIGAIYDNFGSQDNQKSIRGGAAAVAAGASQVSSGAGDLSKGTSDLNQGAKDLSAGADGVSAGAKQVAEGASGLSVGAGSLSAGAAQVAQGAGGLKEGIGTLQQGVSGLTSEMKGKIQTLSANKAGLAQVFQAGKANSLDTDTVVGMTGIPEEETKQLVGTLYQGFISGGTSDADSYLTGMIGALTMVSQELGQSGLAEGVQNLADGAAQLTEGAADVADGASDLARGASALSNGASQVAAGADQVSAGAKQVSGGAGQVSEGAMALSAGSRNLSDGAGSLQSGVEMLYGQAVAPVKSGVDALISSMPTLTAGISQLSGGAGTLVSNNSALNTGASKLSDAAAQVADGVDKLEDGSNQLMDGMVQFDKDGIQKLADAYHGDIKTLLNRLEAVIHAGKNYQTFTKVAEGTTGSVKFIVRTEAVKAED